MRNIKRPVVKVFISLVILSGLSVPISADNQSIETLLAYLKSPEVKTRRDAATKLGERRLRDPIIVRALVVSARKDQAPSVRSEAVKSLGMIKDMSALSDMFAVLKDSEPEVRGAAVKSLVSLYTENDIDFITSRRTGWNWFNPFLDTSDHEIVEPYIQVEPTIVMELGDVARNDHTRNVRIAAIRALGVLRGQAAIPQLADALKADSDVRIDAIRTFIKIGDPSAGRHLVPFFSDSDKKIATQAMFAVGILKYRDAVEPLMSVYGIGGEKPSKLSKVTHKIRGRFVYLPPRDEAALWALSLIGDRRAEQIFVENADDKEGTRRQYAFEGLARIGNSRYLSQIANLALTEKDDEVKLAEYWAMYKMGDKQYLQYVSTKLDSSQNEQAFGYLLEANDPADLYPYLRSSNRVIRNDIIDILGRIGNAGTIKELEPIVQSSGGRTAERAVVAIKRIEWRLAGGPKVNDDILRRETRPRRVE